MTFCWSCLGNDNKWLTVSYTHRENSWKFWQVLKRQNLMESIQMITYFFQSISWGSAWINENNLKSRKNMTMVLAYIITGVTDKHP